MCDLRLRQSLVSVLAAFLLETCLYSTGFGQSYTAGQSPVRRELRHDDGTAFGIKAGLSFSKLEGGTLDNSDFTSGFLIGAFYSIGKYESIRYQLELSYVNKGHQLDEWSTEVALGYLEIPVLIKYYIPTLSSAKPTVFIGPAISLLLSANLKFPDGDKINTKKYYNDIDFGLVFGTGIDLLYENSRAITDFRFTLGARDIIDEEEGGPDTDIRNGSFNLAIGYQF